MLLDDGTRTIECSERIVGEKKFKAGVEVRCAFAVQSAKGIEPKFGSGAEADTDFQDEDFRRELLMEIEILEKRPEIGHAVGDGVGMIGVGLAAREGQFIAAACGSLPVGELVPVEAVELPSDAVTKATEVLEWDLRGAGGSADAVCGGRGGHCSGIVRNTGDRAEDLLAKNLGLELTSVDVDIPDRARAAVRRPNQLCNGHGFAKVVLVLDPVEMDAEAGELFGLKMAFFEQSAEGLDDLGGGEGRWGLLGVVDLQDHRRAERRLWAGVEEETRVAA
jgi:hypothetical protein